MTRPTDRATDGATDGATGRRARADRRRRGALLLALAGPASLLVACGGPDDVTIATHALDADQQAACKAFVAALPDVVAKQKARAVTPADAPGKAYGDPAVTVTCGAAVPASYSPGAACEQFNGVGWYVPDNVYSDQSADAVLTTVGYRPIVQLVVPADYRPDGPFLAIGELSGDVKKHLQLVRRCS